jgi:hypothetical protein
LGAGVAGRSDSGGVVASTGLGVETSTADDPLTNSSYRIERLNTADAHGGQSWTLDYIGGNGTLFNRVSLPRTSKVAWRGLGGKTSLLSTSAWVRVCRDRVWTVQDGYVLQFQSWDLGLLSTKAASRSVSESAEVVVVTKVECAPDLGISVEGYSLGVSDIEPSMTLESVGGEVFSVELGGRIPASPPNIRNGAFSIVETCSVPPVELKAFCDEGKAAVGW